MSVCDRPLKPRFVELVGKIVASSRRFLLLEINHVPIVEELSSVVQKNNFTLKHSVVMLTFLNRTCVFEKVPDSL